MLHANGRNPPLGMRYGHRSRREILWAALPFVLGMPLLLGLVAQASSRELALWDQGMLWYLMVAFAVLAIIAAGEVCGRRCLMPRVQEQEYELDNLRRQLWRSEQRFRAILDQSAIGIAVAGMDGRILTVNERLCATLGYSCEQLRYRSYREITEPMDLRCEDAQAQRLVQGEIDSYEVKKRLLRHDGSPVWVHVTCSAVRGDVDYVIAIVQEISEPRPSHI